MECLKTSVFNTIKCSICGNLFDKDYHEYCPSCTIDWELDAELDYQDTTDIVEPDEVNTERVNN